MSFLLPTAFILTALIPIIIAMYLLKLRREERLVSSVYLWQRMVRDVEANAPWQRLRRNLLLLLQILFLALLILALARPFLWAEGATGRHVILILDASASMAARDVAPDRLTAAKTRAREIVAGLPDDARVTVIAAGENGQVTASATGDRRQLRQAIDTIQSTGSDSDMTAALNLAAAIAARQPDTEIVILSDGNVILPPDTLPAAVRYVPIGVSGDNQALSALSLQQATAGQVSLFVQAANYGRETAHRRLNIYADGQLFDAHDLEILPGDQRTLVLDDLPAGTQLVEARLEGQDALPLDDRAWAVRRSGEPAAVTLVTGGNVFLETALALLPGLELTAVKTADYEEGWNALWAGRLESGETNLPAQRASQSSSLPAPRAFHPSNLTILDAYAPITATLPAGNLLFVAPPHSTDLFSVTGVITEPRPRTAEPDEPLLRYVDLREAQVLRATRLVLPGWGRTVIVDERGHPLLFVGEVDGRRVGVLAFDLHHTDLVLRPAFPLLLSNLMNYLAPGAGGELPDQIAPGQSFALQVGPGVQEVMVEKPGGERARLAPEAGRVIFADTGDLGVYRVSWQDGVGEQRSEIVAVNLFSPQESDIAPQESLPIGGAGATGESEAHTQQARRELWRPLGMAALAILLIEWLVYQRNAVARVMGWIQRACPHSS